MQAACRWINTSGKLHIFKTIPGSLLTLIFRGMQIYPTPYCIQMHLIL